MARAASGRSACSTRGTFPTRIAAELKDFRLAHYLGDDAARWKNHGRNTQVALAAAGQAVEQSGLLEFEGRDPTRFGVYLGAGEGQQDFPRFVDLIYRSNSATRSTPACSRGSGWDCSIRSRRKSRSRGRRRATLASVFGRRGPNLSCLTACAASAQAIGEAVEIIRRGGGRRDARRRRPQHDPSVRVTGFVLLTAMSTRNDEPWRASRPFDRERDGFVIGEGGGMLVLEELEHARARGAASSARSRAMPRRPTLSA